MVERVLCIHEVPGSIAWILQFLFLFKMALVESDSRSQVIVTGSGD